MSSHGNSFYWGPHVTVLFKPVHVSTPLALLVAAIVLALLAILYEGLRCLRVNLAEQDAARRNGALKMLSPTHAIQTVLYLAEFCFSYILMLSVMTFNGWLFLAIVVGSTIGFQLCRVYSLPHGLLRSKLLKGSSSKPDYEIEDRSEKPANCCGEQIDLSNGNGNEKEMLAKMQQMNDDCTITPCDEPECPETKLDTSEYDNLLREGDSCCNEVSSV